MKGLVQVADQVHKKLERDSPIGSVERKVGQTFSVIRDPVYDTVTPPVASRSRGNSRLPWAVAVSVVACRLGRNVDVMPEGGLVVVLPVLVGPCRNIR